MELKDLLNLVQKQKLEEAEQQKANLESMISNEDLLPEVRSAYELALDRTEDAVNTQAQDPILQQNVAALGSEGLKGLVQIEPLAGILGEDELSSVRGGLEARVQTAQSFFEKYGAHSPEALEFIQKIGAVATDTTLNVVEITEAPVAATPPMDVLPLGPSLEVTDSGEITKTNVAIHVRQNTIQLGKQGRIVPLSKKHSQNQRDYSVQRLAALEYMVANQQREEITPYEIWSAVSSDDYDREVFTQIQKWLTSLTYRRQQIIKPNGKRGTGSRYCVEPSLSLAISYAEELTQTSSERGPETFIAQDAYIAVRHLGQFNPILQERDCPIIEKDLIVLLEKYQPDYSHIRGNARAIWQTRQAALDRAENFLSSDDAFFAFLETVDESTPEYKFMEYLFGLEAEQRELLKRLLGAKVEREVIGEGKIRFWAVSAHDKDDIIAYSDLVERQPSPIIEMIEDNIESQTEIAPEPDNIIVMQPDETIQIPQKDELPPASDNVIKADESVDRPNKRRLSGQRKEQLVDSIAHVDGFIDGFMAKGGIPDQLYTISQLRNLVPAGYGSLFTPTRLRHLSGRESTHTSVKKEYGLREMLEILIDNSKKIPEPVRIRSRHVLNAHIEMRLAPPADQKESDNNQP